MPRRNACSVRCPLDPDLPRPGQAAEGKFRQFAAAIIENRVIGVIPAVGSIGPLGNLQAGLS